MDILATQVYEDDSFTPTQQLSHSLPHNIKEKHIGTLRIGCITYPIEQGITKIGRHPECDIVLNDQTVSKKHAEIEVNNDETWICDLHSSNKTKLNSTVLRSGRYYELKGGSVVEFGMVRAVYSVLDGMDESFIPQTPAINHTLTKEMIIPVMPDTSMNCSSTSTDNVSIIPGTQAEKGDSVFRRPSVPLRTSVSSHKTYIPDSSSDDSMNDSRDSSALGKENLDENRVSTHDMETQNSFESQSNLSDDIHDVQTQKICLDSFLAAKQSRDQTDIHSRETQHEEDVDSQHFVIDIHDVETQHDIDIDDPNTSEKTEVQNTLVENDEGANDAVEKAQMEKAKEKADVSMEAGKSEIKEEESCSNAVDRPEQAVTAKDENSGNSEQLETDQRGSQDCLELSIAPNFDDECSELERTSSQNLLENVISDDDAANESGSKSISPLKPSANNNETTEKSSDEENIFDMATQANTNNENVLQGVTTRIDYTFKASPMEDDSDEDTDQEGVFQRYSRIASQDSSQGTILSKSQPDSDDSATDEEGQFVAMVLKEKRTSVSLYENKETKNDAGSSRNSDDLFDIATQKVNLENSSKEQGDVSKDNVDFNMATQLIEVNKPENVAEKGNANYDTPTQVIEVSKPEDVTNKRNVDFDTPTQLIEVYIPEDVAEEGNADFDTPTQVIEVSKPEDVTNKRNVDFDTPMQVIEVSKPEDVTNERNVDFDTPTQLIEVNIPEDVAEKGNADFDTPTQVIEVNIPEDVTNKRNVDFDTPMQVTEVSKPEDVTNKRNADFDTPMQVIEVSKPEDVTNERNVDFDTPTQLIEVNIPEDVTNKRNVDFDTPMQVIEMSKPEDVTNERNVDFDTPTQLIDVNIPEDVAEKGNADFDTPTQVIEVSKPEDVTNERNVYFDTPTQLIEVNIPEDVAEKGNADFDTPTQMIEVSKPEDVTNKRNADFDTPTQVIDTNQSVNVTEKGSVSFDTPMQLIEANNPEDVVEKGSADFDTPTQVIEVSKPEDVTNEVSVDFDTPTQLIDTNRPVNLTDKGSVSFNTPMQLIEDTNKDEDDLMPTQILPIGKIYRNVSAAAKGNTTRNEDKDEGETDYNTPTQIIVEKVPIYNEPSSNDSEQMNSLLVEEFSMEDIDYEMAPTQLLSDIEEKKKVALPNKKTKSGKLNRVNLDDTVERNLNEMFDDVNEDIEDDQPQMSTQVLTNMLESPEKQEESTDVNVDNELPGCSKEKTSPRRTKGKSTGAKLEVSPLLISRKSRRSSLKKAITNDDSQNCFSNLTAKRKRNLLAGSPELATMDEDKVDTEFETKSKSNEEIKTKKTLNDENNISTALLKSSPKNSPSTKFSRTNKPEELLIPEPVIESVELVKGNKNVAVELDRGDEISITSVNTGQFGRAITQDSDEDIMAGLPEVQILGTLSNPASPSSSTSTEFRFTTRSMKPKSSTKKTEPKKKVLPKKSTRKSVARTNVENNDPPGVSRLRSTAFLSSFDNFNISRVPGMIYENDDDIVNEIKQSNRTSSRKSKESGSLQIKPNSLCAEVRLSPSIQDNGRTRGSIKEYSSSVFQVGKDALVAMVAEPVRKTAAKTSRAVKRSLSTTDVLESNAAKKRKENVTEKAPVASKGRKSTRGVAATRSNSANILDYMSRRDSPVFNSDSSQQSVSSSQESFEYRQLKVMVRRLSSDTPTPPPLLTPTRSTKEDGRISVTNTISNSSKAENDKSAIVEEKVHPTRGNRNKRAASKHNVEDDSSQMGEESQEIEMIMNSWVTEENVKQRVTNESTIVEERVHPTRGNRSKRAASKRNVEDDSSRIGEEMQEVEMTMNSGVKEDNAKQEETNESTIVEEKVHPTRGNRSKRAVSKRNVEDDSSRMGEEMQEVEMTMNSGAKEDNDKQRVTNESTIVEERVHPTRGNRSKRAVSKRNVEDDSSRMGEEMQEVEMTMNSGAKEDNDKQEEANESTIVEEKVHPTRGNRSKRAVSKRNVEDDSSRMGEEMQEVEMTMNSGAQEDNNKQEEANESTIVEEKVHPTRGNRSKRAASKRNVEDDSSRMGEEMQEVEMTMNSGAQEDNNKQEEANESTIVEEKVHPTRGNRSKRAASKRNVEDDSSQMGEEMQEVEMTMNSGVKEDNVKQGVTNESTIVEVKVHPARGGRSKKAASKRNVGDDSSRMGEGMQEVEMAMNSGVKEDNVKQEETNESTKGARGRGKGARSTRSMNVSFTTSNPAKIKHKILFTGITNEYSKLLAKLGSSQVEDPAKCTVLVTDKVRRTVKFLCALAQAVPIVSVSWLVDSEKAGHFTELDNYILKDPAAEAKFGFRLRGSLEKAKKQKLLDGYTIVLTPNVAPPPVQELKSIISSCGGKPLIRPPSSWPQNAVIISREEDMANAKKFLAKASKTVTIQSTEFILTGILQQELNFVKYKLT